MTPDIAVEVGDVASVSGLPTAEVLTGSPFLRVEVGLGQLVWRPWVRLEASRLEVCAPSLVFGTFSDIYCGSRALTPSAGIDYRFAHVGFGVGVGFGLPDAGLETALRGWW